MPLFWIVNEIDGKRHVFVQEAGALIFARLKASLAGFEGQFVEARALQPRHARPATRPTHTLQNSGPPM
jgi:hypothetical protein